MELKTENLGGALTQHSATELVTGVLSSLHVMNCVSRKKAVENFDNLLGKVGIELSQSTLRTEKCMVRGLVTDSEAIQYTTVSLSFNREGSDSFGGYVRLLHMDITNRKQN